MEGFSAWQVCKRKKSGKNVRVLEIEQEPVRIYADGEADMIIIMRLDI